VVTGPDLVMLAPQEEFTVVTLSGGRPKRPQTKKSITLLLGPDFMADVVEVETSDHARLRLNLAYNWQFTNPNLAFNVPDFVGDACLRIASKIRGEVARVAFDRFHRQSAQIIREAVFGPEDKPGQSSLIFETNGLKISAVDIQSVEPVDEKTLEALRKSVQLAIEITTSSQEATARHEASSREQAARGKLDRQSVHDATELAQAQTKLIEFKTANLLSESRGGAVAKAEAEVAAQRVTTQAQVERAKLEVEAMTVRHNAELKHQEALQTQELQKEQALANIKLQLEKSSSEIQVVEFEKKVHAIGPNTIAEMARGGVDSQAKLLRALGLQGYLITDGKTPLNLFKAADGLLGVNGTKNE